VTLNEDDDDDCIGDNFEDRYNDENDEDLPIKTTENCNKEMDGKDKEEEEEEKEEEEEQNETSNKTVGCHEEDETESEESDDEIFEGLITKGK